MKNTYWLAVIAAGLHLGSVLGLPTELLAAYVALAAAIADGER